MAIDGGEVGRDADGVDKIDGKIAAEGVVRRS